MEKKPVIVQHRAPLGSSERFVGFLMEHFAGAFPVWLSPMQSSNNTNRNQAHRVFRKNNGKNERIRIKSLCR